MAGVQNLLRRLDHGTYRNRYDNDVDLDLRKERSLHRNAAVEFRLALLYAAAENVGDGHTGDADIHHCRLESLKTGFAADDLNLGELRRTVIHDRSNLLYRNGLGNRCIARNDNRIGGLGEAVRKTGNRGSKVRVGTRKTVLGAVQTADLLLGGNPETDGLFDDHECDRHAQCSPCKDGYDTKRLNA